MPYANNKGADQPAYPRNLISTFIVHYLDGIISLVLISVISSLYVASVAVQAGLCLTWSQTPKTGFFVAMLMCDELFRLLNFPGKKRLSLLAIFPYKIPIQKYLCTYDFICQPIFKVFAAHFKTNLDLILSQSLNLGDRRGTTDNVATIPFHPSLSSAALRESPNPIPVHSLMLPSHLFFCLPLLSPFTAPCRIVFAMPEDLEMWPYHLSFRFFTMVRRSSCTLGE